LCVNLLFNNSFNYNFDDYHVMHRSLLNKIIHKSKEDTTLQDHTVKQTIIDEFSSKRLLSLANNGINCNEIFFSKNHNVSMQIII
jgi:hypothetical protein